MFSALKFIGLLYSQSWAPSFNAWNDAAPHTVAFVCLLLNNFSCWSLSMILYNIHSLFFSNTQLIKTQVFGFNVFFSLFEMPSENNIEKSSGGKLHFNDEEIVQKNSRNVEAKHLEVISTAQTNLIYGCG